MGMCRIKDYIKLIRIKHWIKNGLVFLPMFFAMVFTKKSIESIIVGFFAFSFMASLIYVINDLRDVEKDRNHPRKKERPIASGRVGKVEAIILALLLLIIAIILNYYATGKFLNTAFMWLFIYLVINLFYSFGAKNIPILDVCILTAGFIIRVYYGAAVVGVTVSNWLFLTILNASLFLGLGKRRKELKIKDGEVRAVLKCYNEKFLENFMNICLGLFIVFYSLWTMEQATNYMFLSVPILIVILMQYMLFLETSDEGDPITLFFQHKSLIITAIIYVAFMFITTFSSVKGLS